MRARFFPKRFPRPSKTVILKWAETFLDEIDFFIMPIDALWSRINTGKMDGVLSKARLTGWLKADRRFFVLEDKAMLVRRIPSQEKLLSILAQKVEESFETLKAAWDNRPPDDAKLEDKLLEALARTQKLQRTLRRMTDEPGHPA
jgi:hypothetical protein